MGNENKKRGNTREPRWICVFSEEVKEVTLKVIAEEKGNRQTYQDAEVNSKRE